MPPEPRRMEPLDINILPGKYRPRVISPAIRLAWLVAVVLLVLLVPAFFITLRNRARAGQSRDAVTQARRTLVALATPAPEVAGLTEELSRTLHALEVVQTVYPTVSARQRDWASVFEAILSRDSERIQLTGLLQEQDDLTLIGYALTQEDVLSYKNVLERSGAFQQVMIRSMRSVVLPSPTATPTGTVSATPTAIGATPTISPYDAFEIDDFEPRAISAGETQEHNFSPIYDVDQVTFLGKAGRRYCIQALPQAIGVDTFLEVSAGGAVYTNDDCQTGEMVLPSCQCPIGTVTASLASLVEVQMPGSHDLEVRVRVSNRGQYGPDKWYTLLVYEAKGDAWERDDLSPRPISVGEAQTRTFHPDGDVDRVTFDVKGGNGYRLRTLDLAVGVDTAISVVVDGVVYENDDASAGHHASLVEFQAMADGVAEATVTNKGQFGADMSYVLQLLEMGGDSYEPDDYAPRPLSPWEHQRHTFYPKGDIDRVEFNVKAGHIYDLSTYSLTVGVDTVLSVLVNGVLYENDDVAYDDHSSRVVLSPSQDGVAGATISNREQFGADKEYWLTLTDLAHTPTPSVTPTPTATTTPDCLDMYEPDDNVPCLMVVNEEQEHNFCRPGDLDRAVFTAKDGYAYQVETTDLAPGVDTCLTVQIGDTTLTNDDRGHEDLSSSVRIQNTTGSDAPVFVSVANEGLFGPGTRYTLRVGAETGDAYEPDLTIKRYISVREVQLHTFDPDADVDRATLMVKGGRQYVATTCGNAYDPAVVTSTCEALLPGVDTLLEVSGPLESCDPASCQNDDACPGGGSFASRLVFTATVDGEVDITIYNKGQFGPTMQYYLRVDEIAGPTPTVVTQTPTPPYSPTLPPSATVTPTVGTLTPTPTTETVGGLLPDGRLGTGLVSTADKGTRLTGLCAPLPGRVGERRLAWMGNENVVIEFELLLKIKSAAS